MRELIHMTWKEIEALDRDKAIMVMPIGSVEQHGPHLPVGTDYLIAQAFAQRLTQWKETSYMGILLPTIQFGVNAEHAHFQGTIRVPQESISSLLEGQCNSLMEYGFHRFVILNSHGGNSSLLDSFVRNYRISHPCQMTAFTYLSSTVYKGHEELFENEVGLDIHAGEFETSIMQYIYPQLVKDDLARTGDECNLSSRALPPGWLTRELSRSGVMGRPSLATAEKGQEFFRVAEEWLMEKIEGFASAG